MEKVSMDKSGNLEPVKKKNDSNTDELMKIMANHLIDKIINDERNKLKLNFN